MEPCLPRLAARRFLIHPSAFLLLISLRFKKLHGSYPYWSVRFGSGYRAVCRRDGDTAEWIWIGTHQDFDKAF